MNNSVQLNAHAKADDSDFEQAFLQLITLIADQFAESARLQEQIGERHTSV